MPAARERMSYRRYCQIKRYLHYCDESACITDRRHPQYDKLYKVRFVYEHLKKVFIDYYQPGADISVDECMIPFTGRWGPKAYDKSKPIRWGVKVYMACCADSAYAFSLDIYSGRDADFDDLNTVNKVAAVVVKLVQELWGEGYHIFTDRFYTAPLLFHWLRSLDLSATGTCNTNRKHFPKELIDKKDKEQGRSEWRQCKVTGIVATRWTDKRPIYFLSNGCVPEVSGDSLTVKRRNKKGETLEVRAPPSVVLYNQKMGGVDLNDKMAKLDKSRKSTKWYIRIDRKFITWTMFNSYILYRNANPGDLEFREFILEVLTSWMGPARRPAKPVSSAAPPRILQDGHFPVISEDDTTNNRCIVCEKKYAQEKKENPGQKYKDFTNKSVKTAIKCSVCRVYLCVKRGSSCFADYHTKVEYWR